MPVPGGRLADLDSARYRAGSHPRWTSGSSGSQAPGRSNRPAHRARSRDPSRHLSTSRRPCPTNSPRKKLKKPTTPAPTGSSIDGDSPTALLTWAQRLKRVFEIDIIVCPHCGGTLRFIADVTDSEVIRTILEHLQQRAPPELSPRQALPLNSQADFFSTS